MIGQHCLLKQIFTQVQHGIFPRFSIIVGDTGSEKNDIAHYISNLLDAHCVDVPDVKVETIRTIIDEAYKIKTTTVYNIQDADGMSLQARNALLKVTEEPPNKAYFVMVLEDENNTLATIRSRGVIYELEPYSKDELMTYCTEAHNLSSEDCELVLRLANNPGDVDVLVSYKASEFYNFVEKVIDNIALVGLANAFKISQSIKFKDTDEKGYDLKIFFKVFCLVCFDKQYYKGLLETSRYLSTLHIKTVNKNMVFDSWVTRIREVWIDGCC